MSTETKISHSEAAESIFSLHLFWSVQDDEEYASALRDFSLRNNLFRTVSWSIPARLGIPFIICMAKRGKTYCAPKDDTFDTLRKILNKKDKILSADATEAWNATIGDMTNPLLTEDPPKDPSRSIRDKNITKHLAHAASVTESDYDLLKKLIKKSWQIHVEIISEVLTSIDIHDHLSILDEYLVLDNLPLTITSAYRSKFLPLTSEIPSIKEGLISELEAYSEQYDPKDMQAVQNEVMDFLNSNVEITKRFQSRVQDQEPTPIIRICDMSETGYLNYPFPPL